MGTTGPLRSVTAIRAVLRIQTGEETASGVYTRLGALTVHQLVRRVAQALGFQFTHFACAGVFDTDGVARLTGHAVSTWTANGFPAARDTARTIDHCIRTLVAWLLPPAGRAARESTTCWKLLGSLSSAFGLCHLHVHHTRRPHLRSIIRAFLPEVQHALLHGTFGQPWVDYVCTLACSIWDPGDAPRDALCYVAFSSRAAMWYVGKSTSTRQRHDNTKPGWLERFREHLLATARRGHPQAHRERYKAWAAADSSCVHMVPFAWTSSREVLWLEALAIRLLQPPSQRNDTTADRTRERPRRRPWPHQRRRPTLQEESRLCLQAQIAAAPRVSALTAPFGLDYKGLVAAARAHWGWSKQLLDKSLYLPGQELFLCTYLTEARIKLSCKLGRGLVEPNRAAAGATGADRRAGKTRVQRAHAKV